MTRLAIIAAALGGVGLVATGVGVAVDRVTALGAYVVALTYWVTLALGCLVFALMAHAGRMRWLVTVRRLAELCGGGLVAFVVLIAPLFVFASDLYPWAGANTNTSPLASEVLQHRQGYLSLGFGLARSALCMLVLVGAAEFVLRLARRFDEAPTLRTVTRLRVGAAVALPAYALALTCAAFDWLMVLDATYFSTAFGVYVFAGGFVGALGLLAVLMQRAGRGASDVYAPGHFHALGRLMLSFAVFWVYIAYSQFFLAWMADLPEEISYYLARMQPQWTPLAWALVLVQFVLPFFLLLPRAPKLRARYTAGVGAVLLAGHYLDAYWLVMPSVTPENALPSLWHLSAFVGVGGVSAGLALWRARSWSLVPTHDPDLPFALRYQP